MLSEWLLLYPELIGACLITFSLLVGSFLNVVIYRLPIMLHAQWKSQCSQWFALPNNSNLHINLFLPRSFCLGCKQTIPAWQNIPLLSYALLRGRCYQCKAPIPWRYPVVEALTLGLSCLALWQFDLTLSLLFALAFIWLLIAASFIDLEHQLLPDELTLSLLWLGLIANTQSLFTPLPTAVLSAVAAYLGLWLFIKLFYLLTGKIGMGHGDFKLFAAFGAWFGWTQLPLILLLASFFGAAIGSIYLRYSGQSKNTPIPFGPFLCFAGLISLFWGSDIVAWYILLAT